jgi:hypothetical protein
MATKLSIAVLVKDGVVSETIAVVRKEADVAIKAFKDWRDAGHEAYLFHAPEADKRSTKQTPAVVVTAPTVVDKLMDAVMNGKKKKAEPVAIDLE